MLATVRLKDIVDGLEMQFEDSSSFLNLDTGQVETVSHDLLSEAEEAGEERADLPDWQKGAWEVARRIVSTQRFLKLPTKFDIHEWSIMEEFSHSADSRPIQVDLLNALHGRGAFQHFKDTVRRHGIEQDWFNFRDEALREIAIEWCEEHNIQWH
jgi:Uncharacterised protein family (UPF0158)